jgi:Cu/Ag efflux protein CusF
MKSIRARAWGFALAAALLAALAACERGGSGGAAGTGRGTVVAVDAERGELTLDHGEIPGVMGAMTMPFAVADPKLLEGLEPGARVEFDVEHAGGRYRITGIRRPTP